MNEPRYRQAGGPKKATYIKMDVSLWEQVDKIASYEQRSVAWMISTLVREAIEARGIQEAGIGRRPPD